jgi:poly(A) polymerase
MLDDQETPPESTVEVDHISPVVIPRAEHPISRKMIDEEALKVLYRLHHHGYLSFLVGGSVRDLLLGRVPKDFDVATNAHPLEIKALFRNSRVIGRRFRLVHVFFKDGKVVEVSTFRSHSEFEEVETEEGTLIRTESFGTHEEDAFRRDLTINGLFYNIADFSIIDCVGGMKDLERKVIRTIGDPGERFQQDPVRMIRTLRHAARTGFTIDERTYQAILQHRDAIQTCSPSRVRDEFLRDLKEGVAEHSLKLMLETSLLLSLFPEFQRVFGNRNPFRERATHLFLSLFGLVDRLLSIGRDVPESVILALFLTPYLQAVTLDHPFIGERERQAYRIQTIRWATHQIVGPFSFPRGTKEMASQILIAQPILMKAIQRGGFPKRFKDKKYFREAALYFGIEAEAKGGRVPAVLRHTLPADFLPWWPQDHRREHPWRRPRRRKRFRTASPADPGGS